MSDAASCFDHSATRSLTLNTVWQMVREKFVPSSISPTPNVLNVRFEEFVNG